MSSTDAPRLSIGLPVYNGERYLGETIDCLLGQDFSDFELIISDNASSDRTEEIARSYAARDGRVRYLRNRVNLGANPNFNSVVGFARGRYFKWASHDDLYMPDCLSRCIQVLASDPSVVNCYPKFIRIDEHGVETARQSWSLNLLAATPHQRFEQLLSVEHGHSALFGVIRTDLLRRTHLLAPYWGADRALLAELALYGRFVEIADELFLWRDHPARSPYVSNRATFADTRRQRRVDLMHVEHAVNYARILGTAQIPLSERVRCVLALTRALRRRSRQLRSVVLREFMLAAQTIVPERR